MNPASIVAQIPDAVIFVDRDGVIRLWNPGAANLFGYSNKDAFGQSLDPIIPERFRASHWKAFHEAIAAGRTKYGGKVLTTRASHESGKKLYVDLSFAIITDSDGRVAGSAAVARDATDRYTYEMALRRRIAELESRITQPKS